MNTRALSELSENTRFGFRSVLWKRVVSKEFEEDITNELVDDQRISRLSRKDKKSQSQIKSVEKLDQTKEIDIL